MTAGTSLGDIYIPMDDGSGFVDFIGVELVVGGAGCPPILEYRKTEIDSNSARYADRVGRFASVIALTALGVVAACNSRDGTRVVIDLTAIDQTSLDHLDLVLVSTTARATTMQRASELANPGTTPADYYSEVATAGTYTEAELGGKNSYARGDRSARVVRQRGAARDDVRAVRDRLRQRARRSALPSTKSKAAARRPRS